MLIYIIIKYLVKSLIFLKNNTLKVLFNNIIFIIFKKIFKYYYIFFIAKNLFKSIYIFFKAYIIL